MTEEEIDKLAAKMAEFKRQYLAGEISRDVLRAHLRGLGGLVVAIEINDELALIDLEAVHYRHQFLMSNPPKCPSCGTEQVQLVGKDSPARWKCRMCKYPWVHEPQPK